MEWFSPSVVNIKSLVAHQSKIIIRILAAVYVAFIQLSYLFWKVTKLLNNLSSYPNLAFLDAFMCQKARTSFDERLISFPCNNMSTPQRCIFINPYFLASVVIQVIPSIKKWWQNDGKSLIQVAIGSRKFPLFLMQRNVSAKASDWDPKPYLSIAWHP